MAPDNHAWPTLHRAANIFGMSFKIIPRRWRFDVAMRAAKCLHPIISRTQMCKRQAALGIDRPQEICAYIVLKALTHVGVEFDIKVRHEGKFGIDPKRGALIAAPHSMLIYAACRMAHDNGWKPVIFEAEPHPFLGTNRMPQGIGVGSVCLLKCRNALKSGRVLIAMPDKAQPGPHTREVILGDRSIHVATPLFDLAKRTGSQIVFCSARVNRAFNVILTWSEPTGDPVEAFSDFVRREIPTMREGRRYQYRGKQY